MFLQYEGNWAASIGVIKEAVEAEKAVLFPSTLPPKKEAALKAMVETAEEELGGEEVATDYEVEVPEEAPPEAAPPVVAAAAVAGSRPGGRGPR